VLTWENLKWKSVYSLSRCELASDEKFWEREHVLLSFTIFVIIQIALHLKMCVGTLSFTISVWLFARIRASDPLPLGALT